MAVGNMNQIFGTAPFAVTYDYTDIAAGTGIQIFYAGQAIDKNILLTEKFYSERVMTGVAFNGTDAYVKEIDMDFDVTFNLPQKIKGDSIITVPFGIQGSTATPHKAYVIVKIRKVSGGVETDLINNQGKNLEFDTVTDQPVMDAIDVIIPQTHFKKDDTLRLTIELWVYDVTGGSGFAYLGHDPMARATCFWNTIAGGDVAEFTFGTDPSILTFPVPFKIDI